MDVADLREFYAGRLGAVTRRLVGLRLRRHWPSLAGGTLLGLGYALPYLDGLAGEAGRAFGFMPARRGVLHWPAEGASATALVDETLLPLSDGSVDFVLAVHALELADDPQEFLREIWRVLAPQGRALIVVPNRRGMWARFDSTPFGYGQPYSRPQLASLLKEAQFSAFAWSSALYMPPSHRGLAISSAAAFERIGTWVSPVFSGVIMVEAVKQVYAMPGGRRARLQGRPRPALVPALQTRRTAFAKPDAGT